MVLSNGRAIPELREQSLETMSVNPADPAPLSSRKRCRSRVDVISVNHDLIIRRGFHRDPGYHTDMGRREVDYGDERIVRLTVL